MSEAGTTAQDHFRLMVKVELAPELRRLGFRGSGARFELPSEKYWLLLGLQKSTSSTADEVRFTVNLSAVDRQAWAAKFETDPWIGVKPSANAPTNCGLPEFHPKSCRFNLLVRSSLKLCTSSPGWSYFGCSKRMRRCRVVMVRQVLLLLLDLAGAEVMGGLFRAPHCHRSERT